MFDGGKQVIVAKGKKVLTFDLGDEDLDTEALEKGAIGPSGNLRAPTLRVGKTWFVGFNEEAYAERIG